MSKSFIAAIKHDDGTFSGIEQIYHPTPSGMDRWIGGLSDLRRWGTPDMAIQELKKLFLDTIKSGKLDTHPIIKERILELIK